MMSRFSLCLFGIFVCCFFCSFIDVHPSRVGITTLRLYDTSRERPLITEVWYPIDQAVSTTSPCGVWVRCPEARDAPIQSNGKLYPLIVMSHGSGGDRMHNAWLAEVLASNGYMVASVDHYGNTWNNKIGANYIKIWERPQDVSYVIDQLLQHPKFGVLLDPERIGFVGYSMGGNTGIWMIGGRVSQFSKRQIEMIPLDQMPSDVNQDLLESIDFSRIKECYTDPRIKACFVMAPAFSQLFDRSSLQSISVPVYICASVGDITTPFDGGISILSKEIKTSQIQVVSNTATHYIFLNRPSKAGCMVLKKLAEDPPGVDRSRIHEEVSTAAVKFFDKNLK